MPLDSRVVRLSSPGSKDEKRRLQKRPLQRRDIYEVSEYDRHQTARRRCVSAYLASLRPLRVAAGVQRHGSQQSTQAAS
jgi:hypothetical protein